MNQLTPEQLAEIQFVVNQLQIVLGNDNDQRKASEEHLKKIREGDPDKYAAYLVVIVQDENISNETRALASVILRRNLNATVTEKKTVWESLSLTTKEFLKQSLLQAIQIIKTKDLIHKVSNLLVEVAGQMYEENESVWQELLNIVFKFVNSENDLQVDAALQIFNGLFSYIIEHLNKYKDDLKSIFIKTLTHKSLDINLAALQAVSNYLQTVEQKDTKPFIELIPFMYNVIINANKQDDETVLQDALIEFNEIAEIEPKFFQSMFREIFTNTFQIVEKGDYANQNIRQLPVEFYVTVIERIPNIVKKDTELLKQLIELIFKLMIDIDDEIEESWMRPKEGFKDDGDGEDGEDNVSFGKTCIDKIISAVGDEICLPLLSIIVNNTIQNDSDWRYKNAGLMAFSQVGEYIEDIENIRAMIPIVLQHLMHPNPKIRYSALHCIGQISDDMTEEFQETYGDQVLPALIKLLEDPVPRVSAHCCSAITNFMDGATEELVLPYMADISIKLGVLMKNGISIQKENSVTAFATTAVVIKQKFDPHFSETVDLLLNCLNENNGPQYKQYRAQVIEALTLISSSVSEQVFFIDADRIIQTMIFIQQSNMDQNDPQRSYLLSAWQRICLIMKTQFTPYLHQILPSILTMATLKIEMGIEGQGVAEIQDVLNEIRPDNQGEKKANIMTDEIEDKDTAIQMLVVFIEELGAGFAQYIDQVSKILLGLTEYYASDNIRISSCGALASLIKCAKQAQPGHISGIHELAKSYSQNIVNAMENETETECLIAQAQAIKDILDEAEENLLQPESVDQFSDKIFEFIKQSENRIQENNKYEKDQMDGDEQDQLDEEDKAVLKEENKAENELQLSLAEIIGNLFKTHKNHCKNLVHKLITQILPEVAKQDTKAKNKFLLFVLDDMVEFLGPDFLGPLYIQIAEQICKFSNSKFAAIRQASVYGIGMIAQHGGSMFQTISQGCLLGIKTAIDYPMDAQTKEKKSKTTQYNHAKDNAIAALGKVIKYQPMTQETDLLVKSWMNLLPLYHDMEEAQIQNEFLAQKVYKNPQFILGINNERLEQFVVILGEICQKKQSSQETLDILSVVIANMFQQQGFSDQIKALCESKLSEEQKSRIQEVYNKCNIEIRAKVENMTFDQ